MRIVVDTGVFSASLSRRRRAHLEPHVRRMAGQQVFLASVTVSELRYGALVAQWGEPRRQRLAESIRATTVIPVSDALLDTVAELRYACRLIGHPLHDRSHATISGSPAPRCTSARRSSPPTASSRTRQGWLSTNS